MVIIELITFTGANVKEIMGFAGVNVGQITTFALFPKCFKPMLKLSWH